MNVLPQAMHARVWRPLRAGDPRRPLEGLSLDQQVELLSSGVVPVDARDGCSFSEGVRYALQRQPAPRILHVEIETGSFQLYNEFDALRICEGPVPPPPWPELARFGQGGDRVIVRGCEPGRDCELLEGAGPRRP